jgi:hypothetical protein
MLRVLATLGCAALIMGLTVPASAHDGCEGCAKVKKEGEGFCCGHGKAFGVELSSMNLYKAVSGEEVKADEMKCPGCKKAAHDGGECCGKTYVQGKVYKAPVAIVLAKGEKVSEADAAHCEGCKKAYSDNGYCEHCGAGIVAGRLYKGKEAYQAALAAHETLAKAAAEKCETCGIAMVTDGTCDHCKATFKNGEKI